MKREVPTEIADWTGNRPSDLLQALHYPSARLSETSFGCERPDTPIQALMEAAPGDTPIESLEELQPLRELIVDAIDSLTEQQRFIVDAVNSERISLAELGTRLGVSKTHAKRLRDEAYSALRAALIYKPAIQERLGIVKTPQCWQDAARTAVQEIRSMEPSDPHHLINTLREHIRTNAVDAFDGFRLARLGTWAHEQIIERGMPWSVDSQVDLLARKQADYGHDNILAHGITGIAVRASDKYARFNNLTAKGSDGESEPFVDCLWDLIGYGAIALMVIDNTFTLELETTE
jgi:hypothetical protein